VDFHPPADTKIRFVTICSDLNKGTKKKENRDDTAQTIEPQGYKLLGRRMKQTHEVQVNDDDESSLEKARTSE
jgi:hypothetical protein